MLSQRCQRYETLDDLDKYHCTIEEREEYYRHIEEGTLLFAGVDYPMILREAEKEADVILWDGGNNDASFFKPDLHICLVDSLRATDENHYYPGETNVRMADAILVCKTNSLPNMKQAYEHATRLCKVTKPNTPIFFTKSVVFPEARDPETGTNLLERDVAVNMIRGKRVLVVDDGPTLTHGGMAFGAGWAMAKDLGAAEIIDPRPFAKGSLKTVFEKFNHLENVLPAMGYSEDQIKDLEATIQAVDCDTVIIGTPSDITHLMDFKKPSVVARYELDLDPEQKESFNRTLDTFYDRFSLNHHPKAA